jgi:phenylacetate-CoA ligase
MERPIQQRVRDWAMNQILNRSFSNAYLLTKENMTRLVEQIGRRRPALMFGYATALYYFAQFVHGRGIDDIQFRGVYSAGEVLYPHQRALIEETFRCRVFDRYATNELGGIACECEAHSGMHISMESSYIEIIQDGQPVEDGQPGEVVVTNLNNYGFPFIRYRLADIAQKKRSQGCSCGRQSPMLEGIRGRTVDIFRTADGEGVWGDLEGTVFQVEGIKHSQVIQKALDLILVRIVKDEVFEETQLTQIERVIKQMMGNATGVQFEFVDHIPLSESGKYRYSYSELSEPRSNDGLAE